jgi:hypothetical protein
MMRNAGADRDRADAHVTRKDVPTFVGSVHIAAAGEGGHVGYLGRSVPSGNQTDTLKDT